MPIAAFCAGVIAVSAGNEHSLLIGHDGSVYAAGDNFFGQLGNGAPGYDTRSLSFENVLRGTDGACVSVGAGVCMLRRM